MMKKSAKILSAVLALATAFSVAGCTNTTDVPNSETDIQIYLWKSGFGIEFMQEIVNKFNAKQDKYNAVLEYNSNASTIMSTLEAGSDNTYDLYFTYLNNMQDKPSFIKLDDVLEMKADGENVTIGEKYNKSILAGVQDRDGTTNFLTYGNGWCGITYNADILNGEDFEIPRTTDELEGLTMDLEGTVKPWLFFSSTNGPAYWSYPMTAWQVQYDGYDYYYNNMMFLKDEQGNSPSKEVLLKKDGRYEALRVAQRILTPNTVHRECTNTSHTKTQTLFMKGEAAMMPNGSWLLSESGSEGNANVSMMKIPVISSIVDKLEDKEMEDSTLSEIIKAIDEGATESDLCSANDFARIKEARNVMYNNGAEQYVFIPKYSNAIAGAKEFLRYFYSDEALEIFLKNTGLTNAVNFADESKLKVDELSAWAKNQYDFSTELTAITGRLDKANLFMSTGLDSFLGLSYPLRFCAQNPADRRSVDQLWAELTNKINENWEDWK